MFDDKTPHLKLTIPHYSNMLEGDVHRLREAFDIMDVYAEKTDQQLETLGRHATDKNNPHQVTAGQANAYTQAEVDRQVSALLNSIASHAGSANNQHKVTAAQVGAYAKNETYSKAEVDAKIQANLGEYSAAQNYTPNKIVSCDGRLFRCLKNNGPNNGGVQRPSHLPTVTEKTTPGNGSWTAGTLPFALAWTCIAYGSGRFVAVASKKAAWSSDGITWMSSDLPVSQTWRAIAYGNGKFVAVAESSNVSIWSPDGITWHQAALPFSSAWYGVAYGNGKFVAVSGNGSNAAWSADGINWYQAAMPSSGGWLAIACGNGKFVAVPNGAPRAAVWSTDGITWQQSAAMPVNYSWKSIAYGNGKFLALANGLSVVAWSADGITWTQANSMPSPVGWQAVAFGNGKFIAVGDSNAAVKSADCITWTQFTLPSSRYWRGIIFGNGRFVTLGNNSNAALCSIEFTTTRTAVWPAYWKECDPAPIGSLITWDGDYPPRDCLLPDGSLLARASYPDLWEFAAKSGNIAAESEWFDENFSHGNGSTTFRIPRIEQHGRTRQFIKAVQ